MPKNHSIVENIQKYFLLGILIILVITFFKFIGAFIVNLLIAGIIVTAVYPVHKILNKKIHIPRTFSALLSLLITAAVVLLPFVLFIFFVAEQATDAYLVVSDKINVIVENKDYTSLPKIIEQLPFSDHIEKILAYSPFSTADILQTAGDLVGTISSFLLGQTTNVLKHLSLFLIHIVVFLMAMFYFLRDGRRLIYYLHALLPLSEEYRKALFTKLHHLSYGIIYGIFGAAILQGIFVGIGFTIVGIPNAAFWGAIAALFSPLPYIGTSLVWIPAVAALAIGGHWVATLFLLIWSIVLVGMADNVIKPYLIGSTSALHPMAVLLVLLGGTFAYGLKGLILGPFILTLTLAFLHIYQLEYKSVLGKIPKPVVKKK
ncbi:AI-2E family transporter [Patescibacteria group bacterium]|nr:AI-2E family transporter [Patescibacteria group bacterium]MBU1935401.1 AI-2E family transporter [Patescibacteria group bacterium]